LHAVAYRFSFSRPQNLCIENQPVCFFFVQLLTNFVVTYFCGCRLDNLILEAITTLKEPTGSDRASIALYIQVLSLTCLSVITWGICFRNKKKVELLDIVNVCLSRFLGFCFYTFFYMNPTINNYVNLSMSNSCTSYASARARAHTQRLLIGDQIDFVVMSFNL
jgi:hypothetical protein